MDKFTKEEKDRINQLYGTDFKGITPEDAMLIGRWEVWRATQKADYQAKLDAMNAETQAKIDQNNKIFNQAMDNLTELHNLAVARFERLQDGI